MAEINQDFYRLSFRILKEEGVPEYLADAASRIIASDDISSETLGRTPVDIEICAVASQIVSTGRERDVYANSSAY